MRFLFLTLCAASASAARSPAWGKRNVEKATKPTKVNNEVSPRDHPEYYYYYYDYYYSYYDPLDPCPCAPSSAAEVPKLVDIFKPYASPLCCGDPSHRQCTQCNCPTMDKVIVLDADLLQTWDNEPESYKSFTEEELMYGCIPAGGMRDGGMDSFVVCPPEGGWTNVCPLDRRALEMVQHSNRSTARRLNVVQERLNNIGQRRLSYGCERECYCDLSVQKVGTPVSTPLGTRDEGSSICNYQPSCCSRTAIENGNAVPMHSDVYCGVFRDGASDADVGKDVCYRWEEAAGGGLDNSHYNRLVCIPLQEDGGCPSDHLKATAQYLPKIHPQCACTVLRDENGVESPMPEPALGAPPKCMKMFEEDGVTKCVSLNPYDTSKGDDYKYFGCPVDHLHCVQEAVLFNDPDDESSNWKTLAKARFGAVPRDRDAKGAAIAVEDAWDDEEE